MLGKVPKAQNAFGTRISIFEAKKQLRNTYFFFFTLSGVFFVEESIPNWYWKRISKIDQKAEKLQVFKYFNSHPQVWFSWRNQFSRKLWDVWELPNQRGPRSRVSDWLGNFLKSYTRKVSGSGHPKSASGHFFFLVFLGLT